MVSGSSVNPLEIRYKQTQSPYETGLATTTAHTPTVLLRGLECSTPASPSRNSDSHTAAAPLDPPGPPEERAGSPSPSSDSAGGAAAATPPADRPGLGHFSASYPQFGSHSMSPLDRVTASATYSDGVRGGGGAAAAATGFTTTSYEQVGPLPIHYHYQQHPPHQQYHQHQQQHQQQQQLMVTVYPDDLQGFPADGAALEGAAAFTSCSATQKGALIFEEDLGQAPKVTAAGEAAASGLALPPLPPAPPPAPQPQPAGPGFPVPTGGYQSQPPHHPSHALPVPVTRQRHGSVTTISYGAGVSPGDSGGGAAAAAPLAVSPPGSFSEHITRTASLPLLMCNAVLPPGASPAIPIAIAGVGASGRARATTIHTPLATSASFGGVPSTTAAGGGTSGCGGATTTVTTGVGPHRAVAQSVDHHFMQQHITAQQQAAQLQQQFLHHSEGGAPGTPPGHLVGSFSPSVTTSYHSAFPAPPDAAACPTSSGEEVGQPQPHQQQPPSPDRPDVAVSRFSLAAAAGVAAGGELSFVARPGTAAAALAVAAGGRDTDGDEEFVDAVEVQHDDEDHVGLHDQMVLGGRSPAGAAAAAAAAAAPEGAGAGAACGGFLHPPHRLQRCNYAAAEPFSPGRQGLGLELGRPAPATTTEEEEQDARHREPADVVLPCLGSSAPTVEMGPPAGFGYSGHFEDEGGDHIIVDRACDLRPPPGEVLYGREMYCGGGGAAADLSEDDELLEEEEEEGVARGVEDDVDLEEDEVLEEESDDDGDAPLAFGGADGMAAVVAGFGAPSYAMPSAPAYHMQHHVCVNCTRPFWGSVCRYCHHPADTEVVIPELLEGAVQSMLAGAAAQQQQQAAAAAGGRPLGSGPAEGVLLAYDDRCRAHLEQPSPGASPDQGRSHPERPERVAAIMTRLQGAGLLARFKRITGREATLHELVAVHDEELVVELEARTEEVARWAERAAARQAGAGGPSGEDSDMAEDWTQPQRSAHVLDCYFNASTAGCARLAAGSAAEVASRVFCGAARHGAAIIRPPGHHAESSVAMGFCYYNNAAVAARAAQAAGARRVLIMDWDVHHGNGTQRIFYDDPSVLYMSTHRYDHGCFYPGSGDVTETGSGAGTGFTVNVPWNESGVRDADMLAAFRHVIVPIATEFRPDLVIVSAGFDAAEGDPLGGCRVSTAAFSHFASMLSALAPNVLLLEGGYNLISTAAATEACLRVLLGEPPLPLANCLHSAASAAPLDPDADPWVATGLDGVSDSALESVRLALRVQSQFWLAARDHLGAVEAALRERRQRQLLRLQQTQPLQPREQWGWHVQLPAQPAMTPPRAPLTSGGAAAAAASAAISATAGAAAVDSSAFSTAFTTAAAAAAAASGASGLHPGLPPEMFDNGMNDQEVPPPPPPLPAQAPPAAVVAALSEPFLEAPEVEVAMEHRRRMDVSTSGIMDLGEQVVLGDVHMG